MSRQSLTLKKKERRSILGQYWTRPTPMEMDIIDKGDHIEVASCDADVAAWWLGTLRAVYPQDRYRYVVFPGRGEGEGRERGGGFV